MKIRRQKAKGRNGVVPVILLAVLALVVTVGGVGIGLAWKTEVLDKILPPNIKEFLGKKPTDGEPTNGEEPTDGENGESTEEPTKDWSSFNGSDYSLKYPSSWYVMPDGGTLWIGSFPFDLSARFSQQIPSGEVLLWLTVSDLNEPLAGRDFRTYLKDRYPPQEGYTVEEGTIKLGLSDWITVNDGYGSMQTYLQGKVLTVVIGGSTRMESPTRWETMDLIFGSFSVID